ncbi:MAG: hypothetical protein QXH45_01270 [Thermosphaera sp.]
MNRRVCRSGEATHAYRTAESEPRASTVLRTLPNFGKRRVIMQ